MEIKSLPKSVVSSIRSKSNLSTFTQCVVELTSNALDAQSTSIAIRINLDTFTIQTVDNGLGINENNLRAVGVSYMTSKCKSLKDFESNLKYLGYRGEALANLRKISENLTIVSRASGAESTFSKVFNKAKSSSVRKLETERPLPGTTVVAEGIFYQCPVRQQRIDRCFEIEQIRREVERIAVLNHHVSFTVRDNCDKKIVFKTQKCNSTLSALSFLYNEDVTRQFKPVFYKKGRFEISGYISCTACQNKNIQLVYVNRRPVQKTKIHQLIKYIIDKSAIIKDNSNNNIKKTVINKIPDFFVEPRHRNKHSGFVLCITCPYSEYDITFDVKKTLIEFKNNKKVLFYIRTCLERFLINENLIIEETENKNTDVDRNPSRRKDISVSIIKNTVRGFAIKDKNDIDKNKSQDDLNEDETSIQNKKTESNEQLKNSQMDESRYLVKEMFYKNIQMQPGKTEDKKEIQHRNKNIEIGSILEIENELKDDLSAESNNDDHEIKRPKPELWALERNNMTNPKPEISRMDQKNESVLAKTFKSDSLEPFSLVKHIENETKQEEIEVDQHELSQIEKELTVWRNSKKHKFTLDWVNNCPRKKPKRDFNEDMDVIEIKSIATKSIKITRRIQTPYSRRKEVNYYKTFFSHKKLQVRRSRIKKSEKCTNFRNRIVNDDEKISNSRKLGKKKDRKAPGVSVTHDKRSHCLKCLEKNKRIELKVDSADLKINEKVTKNDGSFHPKQSLAPSHEGNLNRTKNGPYLTNLNVLSDQAVVGNHENANIREINQTNIKSFENKNTNVSNELNFNNENSFDSNNRNITTNLFIDNKNNHRCIENPTIFENHSHRSKNRPDVRLKEDSYIHSKIVDKNGSYMKISNQFDKSYKKVIRTPKRVPNRETTIKENIDNCIVNDKNICQSKKNRPQKCTQSLKDISFDNRNRLNDLKDESNRMDMKNNRNKFELKLTETQKMNIDKIRVNPYEYVFDYRNDFEPENPVNFIFNSKNDEEVPYNAHTDQMYLNKNLPISTNPINRTELQSGTDFVNICSQKEAMFSDINTYYGDLNKDVITVDNDCNFQSFNKWKNSVYLNSGKYFPAEYDKKEKRKPLYITPNDFLVSAFTMNESKRFNFNYKQLEKSKEASENQDFNHPKNSSNINRFGFKERPGENLNHISTTEDFERLQTSILDRNIIYNNFISNLKKSRFDMERVIKENFDDSCFKRNDEFGNRECHFDQLLTDKIIHEKNTDNYKSFSHSLNLSKFGEFHLSSPSTSINNIRKSTDFSKNSKDLFESRLDPSFQLKNGSLFTVSSDYLRNSGCPVSFSGNVEGNLKESGLFDNSDYHFRPNVQIQNFETNCFDSTNCSKHIKVDKKTQSTQILLKDESTSPMKRWHSFFDSYKSQNNSQNHLRNKTEDSTDFIRKSDPDPNLDFTSRFFTKNKPGRFKNLQESKTIDLENSSVILIDETSTPISNTSLQNQSQQINISTSSTEMNHSERKVSQNKNDFNSLSQESKRYEMQISKNITINQDTKNSSNFKKLSPIIHSSRKKSNRFCGKNSDYCTGLTVNRSNMDCDYTENVNVSYEPITIETNTNDTFFNEAVIDIINRINTDSSDNNLNGNDQGIRKEESDLQILENKNGLTSNSDKKIKKKNNQSSIEYESIFSNSLSNEEFNKIKKYSKKVHDKHFENSKSMDIEEFTYKKNTENSTAINIEEFTLKRNEPLNLKNTDSFDSSILIDDTFNSENKENAENDTKIIEVDSMHENWKVECDSNGRTIFVNRINGMSLYQLPDKLDDTFFSKKRYDFLPKGMSQMFDIRLQKIDVKDLTPTSKKEIQEKIYNSNLTEDELLTVKWIDAPKTIQMNDDRLKRLFSKLENMHVTKNIPGLHTYKFTKDVFEKLRVIAQLDNKFIVTVLRKLQNETVILFDQHAVHERIRLEQLLSEYREKDIFKTTELKKPINLTIMKCNSSILINQKKRFQEIGLFYETINSSIIKVTSVPTCLYNKDIRDRKQKNESSLQVSLEALIHEYVASLVDTKGVKCTPYTLLNVINSEACRGAIKFGNYLSVEQCKSLVNQLSDCELPFQCAHGRPTLFPVIDIPTRNDTEPRMEIKFEKISNKIT